MREYGRVSRSRHFDLIEISPGEHGVENENEWVKNASRVTREMIHET
jgi:hypothetical protein